MKISLGLVLTILLSEAAAFVPMYQRTAAALSFRTSALAVLGDEDLFEDEEEMTAIAENYLHAKYKATAAAHDHKVCDKDDVREVLRSVLPPVTTQELEDEVDKTLELIMKSNPKNTDDKISEDDFVASILKNSYWRSAGSLVVKELMYFDALYSYYQTGKSILNNEDYEELKDNLTWEGSSVATMKGNEALFVTAVSASRRGDSIMEDAEYTKLKNDLKKEGSWVTARQPDALEKMGVNTFMGYLHRSLAA